MVATDIERQRQLQGRHNERYAEEVARANGAAYLLGNTPSDTTDAPLMLISDAALPTKRIFRAVTHPLPARPAMVTRPEKEG